MVQCIILIDVEGAIQFWEVLVKRGAPRLRVSPRLHGDVSYVSPRLPVYTNAHTHTHTQVRSHTNTLYKFTVDSYTLGTKIHVHNNV